MAQVLSKEFILAEIKRTAAENGGAVLGLTEFCKQTGIKDFEIIGKYWARWSEAVKGAGLNPNPFRTAIKDEVLLEQLISLVRELNHFPVQDELRVRAHTDRSFPGLGPFRRLAGGLGMKLAAKLAHYCDGREGYEDVLSLLSEKTYSPSESANTGTIRVILLGSFI